MLTSSLQHRGAAVGFPADVTVVLADDHELFRAGMARAISAHPRLSLVAEVGNGIDALKAIEELTPDVALLDARMPGLNGLTVCDRVAAHVPPLRTRVLLVTADPDEFSIVEATAIGAQGLLSKGSSRDELCAALVRVSPSELQLG